MSLYCLLNKTDDESKKVHANDYEKITLFSERFHFIPPKGGNNQYFGYCLGCKNKIFWNPPRKENQNCFFRHQINWYSMEDEKIMAKSCRYYYPSKGKEEENNLTINNTSFLEDIKKYFCDNSYWIYNYMNNYIFKDIGKINYKFFIEIVIDIFENQKLVVGDKISIETLPFNILSLMNEKSGNINKNDLGYQSIWLTNEKLENLNFDFIHFTNRKEFFHNDMLGLEFAVNSNDKPIVVHTSTVNIKYNGLKTYINQYKEKDLYNYNLSDEEIKQRFEKNYSIIINYKNKYLEIKNTLNKLFCK